MSNEPVTLINVFTVEPGKQQELIELLIKATEGSVRHAPGFLSARLHRSLDGTKVTMYAQWRSNEEYQAMRKDPGPLPYLQQALASHRKVRAWCMKLSNRSRLRALTPNPQPSGHRTLNRFC